jgi:hypothetical protein
MNLLEAIKKSLAEGVAIKPVGWLEGDRVIRKENEPGWSRFHLFIQSDNGTFGVDDKDFLTPLFLLEVEHLLGEWEVTDKGMPDNIRHFRR